MDRRLPVTARRIWAARCRISRTTEYTASVPNIAWSARVTQDTCCAACGISFAASPICMAHDLEGRGADLEPMSDASSLTSTPVASFSPIPPSRPSAFTIVLLSLPFPSRGGEGIARNLWFA
eukprot:1755481-Rhodomonas_salina.2